MKTLLQNILKNTLFAAFMFSCIAILIQMFVLVPVYFDLPFHSAIMKLQEFLGPWSYFHPQILINITIMSSLVFGAASILVCTTLPKIAHTWQKSSLVKKLQIVCISLHLTFFAIAIIEAKKVFEVKLIDIFINLSIVLVVCTILSIFLYWWTIKNSTSSYRTP